MAARAAPARAAGRLPLRSTSCSSPPSARLLIRLPLGPLTGAAIAVGFGAVTAILWEFGEHFEFIRNSPELATAYTDTLGDLALGLAGSVVAAVVTFTRRP
jgi:hypothetical protein